jgi:hypothetical protein
MLGNGHRVLATDLLSIFSSSGVWQGQLDLADNDLIVHNPDAPTAAASLATINDQLKSGFNAGNGYWDGQGIASTAAADDKSYLTTLGVILNSNNGTPVYTTFDNEPVTSTDVLVKNTFYGDADLSGKVDGTDYSMIDVGYNNHGALTGWVNGDFNYDGHIDGSDYSLIDNAFNLQHPRQYGPPAPTGLTIVQAIAGEIDMQWNPAPDSSAASYNVYAGTSASFVPSAGNLVAAGVTTNAFTHNFTADPSDTWYYKVTAVDGSDVESLPSASAHTTVPASTADNYTDAPNSAPLPNDYIEPPDDAPVNPSAVSTTTPLTDLVAFYGAGSTTAFGNTKFAYIVRRLGGTQRPDALPYRDFQDEQALKDTLALLDANGDHIVTQAEIDVVNVEVLGYSWGALAAANLTRDLSHANPHAGGLLEGNGNFNITYIGGWDLQAPVPIKILVTIDPVLHAFAGLSGLIRSTQGPESNVLTFKNYYQQRGGGTSFDYYSQPPFFIYQGTEPIPFGFSAFIGGDALNSQASHTDQIRVDTFWANNQRYNLYKAGPDEEPLYALMKGSQVQHDTMPLYLLWQVIDDFTNA